MLSLKPEDESKLGSILNIGLLPMGLPKPLCIDDLLCVGGFPQLPAPLESPRVGFYSSPHLEQRYSKASRKSRNAARHAGKAGMKQGMLGEQENLLCHTSSRLCLGELDVLTQLFKTTARSFQ